MANPSSARRVGLAIVDPSDGAEEWMKRLAQYGLRATFIVSPQSLVADVAGWRRAALAGHELGNGALLGVTDDGRLRNWTCEALEAELREADKLHRELGQPETSVVGLPGRIHVCAEGRYAPKLQRTFPLCLGETERLTALRGMKGRLSFALADESERDLVLFLHPSTADQAFVFSQAARLGGGPLRDLIGP